MMEEGKNMETFENGKISDELTYRRYLMNRGKVRDLFQKRKRSIVGTPT